MRPRFSAGSLVSGAIGGVLSTIAGLAVLVVVSAALAVAEVTGPVGLWTAPNAIGAWLVRWLQTAAPDAFLHFYVDATLGGLAIAVVVGALVGALFAGVLDRLPQDHPVAWGVLGGTALWVLSWWRVAPAVDQALVTHVSRWAWLAFCLTYGTLLGVWVSGERVVRIEPLPSRVATGS